MLPPKSRLTIIITKSGGFFMSHYQQPFSVWSLKSCKKLAAMSKYGYFFKWLNI